MVRHAPTVQCVGLGLSIFSLTCYGLLFVKGREAVSVVGLAPSASAVPLVYIKSLRLVAGQEGRRCNS